jgi:hypothetical protein
LFLNFLWFFPFIVLVSHFSVILPVYRSCFSFFCDSSRLSFLFLIFLWFFPFIVLVSHFSVVLPVYRSCFSFFCVSSRL